MKELGNGDFTWKIHCLADLQIVRVRRERLKGKEISDMMHTKRADVIDKRARRRAERKARARSRAK